MRAFKTKWFQKWASKEGLSNAVLLTAVYEMVNGLIEADLGGRVIKKRGRSQDMASVAACAPWWLFNWMIAHSLSMALPRTNAPTSARRN